eukprot:375266-Rhodomonas_salina.3
MPGLDAVESDRREHPIDGLPERLRTQRRLPRSRREVRGFNALRGHATVTMSDADLARAGAAVQSRRWYVQRDDAGADERHSGAFSIIIPLSRSPLPRSPPPAR